MSYGIISQGQHKRRSAVDTFDRLADMEERRNTTGDQIKAQEKATRTATAATSAAMIASGASAASAAGASGAMPFLAAMGPVGWIGMAGLAIAMMG